MNKFASEQDIEAARLELLDVLEASKKTVSTPRNEYDIGVLYKQRLAIGVSDCGTPTLCPVNQALLLDATLLSFLNKPKEFAFKLLNNVDNI